MKINAYNDKDLIYIALGDVNCSMENILVSCKMNAKGKNPDAFS